MLYFQEFFMRTTLSIDDDILAVAKELAEKQNQSIGKIISDLSRKALQTKIQTYPKIRNGVPLLPLRTEGRVVTSELIKELLDELHL